MRSIRSPVGRTSPRPSRKYNKSGDDALPTRRRRCPTTTRMKHVHRLRQAARYASQRANPRRRWPGRHWRSRHGERPYRAWRSTRCATPCRQGRSAGPEPAHARWKGDRHRGDGAGEYLATSTRTATWQWRTLDSLTLTMNDDMNARPWSMRSANALPSGSATWPPRPNGWSTTRSATRCISRRENEASACFTRQLCAMGGLGCLITGKSGSGKST